MTKMWKEIFEQPTVLNNCLKQNNQIIIDIIKDIETEKISNVVIVARGTSDHAGIYGKYIIEHNLGIPVSLAAPSIITMYNKKLILKNSLVIAISQSGQAEDVLEVIKCANEQHAITIGITNFKTSPIALNCKYHLYTNAGIEESVAATKTFTAQMMNMALLVAKWSKDEHLVDSLSKVPEKVRETLKLSEEIVSHIKEYVTIKDCFVLSRGINYAIALESALKIQETTYVKAKGYATSDFHHGPFAMVGKETPVILFSPEGPSLEDAKEIIIKLKKAKARIIIVTNDQQLLKENKTTFEIPKCNNDLITPFYNIIFAQMFACQLALAKGLNPDQPRGLNKVTITR